MPIAVLDDSNAEILKGKLRNSGRSFGGARLSNKGTETVGGESLSTTGPIVARRRRKDGSTGIRRIRKWISRHSK